MLCDSCGVKEECGYFSDTIEPIQKAILFSESDDDFANRIKEALNYFECEYFEK